MERKLYRSTRERTPLWKKLVLYAVYAMFAGIIVFVAAFFYFAKDLPDPQNLNTMRIAQSTKIFDHTGSELLYDIHGEEKRTIIPFDQISEYLKKATIATEDAEFYSHEGIQLRGIIRGAYKTFIKNETVQSGSTITQQLVKNSFLSPEKTFSRKIREIILAIALEKKYSKDEILEMYLNQIPYGSNTYGAEAASQLFFNVKAKDLTVAQAALLAALPKAPSYYSPYGNHVDELLGRKDYILSRMEALQMIGPTEKEQALAEKLSFSEINQQIKAPHFVMFVRDYLNEKYGEKFIETAGYSVITTLDWALQQKAEEIVRAQTLINKKQYDAANASLVVLDPKKGTILAMVGSRDYFDIKNDGNVNVSVRLRSPGSALKPFVYARAMEKGLTPQTMLFDLKTEFNPNCPDTADQEKDQYGLRCYHPQNYTEKYFGPVSVKDALAQSLNVPAVKTLYLVGVDDMVQYAKKLGMTTFADKSRYGLSLVLGGGEVKLLEMAAAYSIFSNEGKKITTTPVSKIMSPDGDVIEEYVPSSEKVMEPGTAQLINMILSDNNARAPIFGEKSYLYIEGYSVAAKTGTAQDYRDAWTMGYSPEIVVGVWVGNNDNSEMKKGGAGIMAAGPIWNSMIKYALSSYVQKPSAFTPVDFPSSDKPMLNGSIVNQVVARVDKISGLLATEQTPANLVEEKTFNQIHSILYYVDKTNFMGPPPATPSDDPLFEHFEKPVADWVVQAQQQSLPNINQFPPTAYDTVHVAENNPVIRIITPAENSEINMSGYNFIETEIQAPLGVKQADYFLDDIFLGSSTKYPYRFNYLPPKQFDASLEEHFLKIRAYDNAQNSSEATVPLLLKKASFLP
jgi:1A family penicillin-binding protein